ncbi:octopamine receptor 1-like [Mercenaria mercenaria]|uniref:octopamine receptor 1-like n=1 Tax=Mercenaria mercenaria TaxID=6596 RepID=UPI00234F253E|nr:octopamine receptor 1-like [Mercenaria mercenaria]
MLGETSVERVLMILQTIVFLMSCSGNAIVVLVIWKYLRRRAVTNKFIVNLAVADMFTGVASLSQILYTFVPSLNDNLYTCLLRYNVVIFMTLTSQLTVTFTTFDRYIAICYPTKYMDIMTPKVAQFLILISWMYPCIISILPFSGLNNWNTHLVCVFQQVVKTWQLLWMALTLWIFTIVTVAMYGLILRKACTVYNQVRPSIGSVVLVRTVEIERNKMENKYRTEKMASVLRGAKALAAVTLVFSLCWLPYTYFQLRAFINSEYIYSREWDIATWIVFLGMANSVMNPFIYAWQRKDFNQACKRLFSCKAPLPRQPARNGSYSVRGVF